MKPVNNQLFYYVLLVYAVAMVAYVVLPVRNGVVVVAGGDSKTRSATSARASADATPAAKAMMPAVAHPVSLGTKGAATAPLLTVPADEPMTTTPAAVKDAPKSL